MLSYISFVLSILTATWLSRDSIVQGTDTSQPPESRSLSSVTATMPSSTPSSAPAVNPAYGQISIHNKCDYGITIFSVGARHLYPNATKTQVFSSYEDNAPIAIAKGTTYTETLRETCPKPDPNNKKEQLCAIDHSYAKTFELPQLAGQGVSLKIARGNVTSPAGDITQIEYTLMHRNGTWSKLHYDISLLDCADPDHLPGTKYYENLAGSAYKPGIGIKDSNATDVDWDMKRQKCPGLIGGINILFGDSNVVTGGGGAAAAAAVKRRGGRGRGRRDTATNVCREVRCDGKTKCSNVYVFGRSFDGEPSWDCDGEYRGNVTVELCASNGM